jgi:pimeloyl-ACP methyl ester carboxylesterase
MPALAAEGRRVVAVDLPGSGASDKPAGGYDKKSLAATMCGLVRALGYERVDIAGHDVGAMVAFSFAANHPGVARRVALLDMVHPDPFLYGIPILPPPNVEAFPWWFAFNQVQGLPEALLAGRARYLVDWVVDTFAGDPASVSAHDRAVYAHAYNKPQAIRSSNCWYQTFGQDIADLAGYAKTSVPLYAICSNLGGNNPYAAHIAQVLPTEGTDTRVEVLAGSGHFLAEEKPVELTAMLTGFFG